MIKKFFIVFLVVIFYNIKNYAQNFLLEIKTNFNTDTVKKCEDTTIRFFAIVKLDNDTIDTAFVYWNFDDGDYTEGIGVDTVEHKFVKYGGYRVFAYAKLDSLYAFDIQEVLIGLDPDFKDIKTDPSNEKGLCSGDKLTLTGNAKSKEWKEKTSNQRIETFPVFIDTSHQYLSSLLFKNYKLNKKIDTATDIISVGLYIEHSDAVNMKISLECPNGKSVLLKDYGGNALYFGEPVLDPGDYTEGHGYWYFWSDTASLFMNDFSGNDTLPSGIYKPQQSFDTLKGCPLDGVWYIRAEQKNTNSQENGYAFGWQLIFNDTIKQDTLKFSNIYDLTYSAWLGDKVNVTSNGIADAYPEEYGEHTYYFYIKDDFGCMHDTSIVVNVEKPDFTVDKYTVYIGDSIHVEDKTSWANEWEWDFGDESPVETDKSLYHKYFEKDTFLITMTVYSQSGCSDFDTAKVVSVPKPIEINDYNIFTPNGDGVNDVFSFFNTPDEKIIAANIEKIKGRIYNRYGETVCKWDTPEEALQGWDGTINNDGIRKAPAGFYYYILIIKGKDGKKYEPFTGVIYLYRTK